MQPSSPSCSRLWGTPNPSRSLWGSCRSVETSQGQKGALQESHGVMQVRKVMEIMQESRGDHAGQESYGTMQESHGDHAGK